MKNLTIMTIDDCKEIAYDYLNNSNLNLFLIEDYKISDEGREEEQYAFCQDIIFDALSEEPLNFQNKNRDHSWFTYLEDEIYKFLVKKDDYQSDNVFLGMALSGIVSHISTYLQTEFSISSSLALGLSSLLIYTIYRLGVNSWIEKYRHNHEAQKNCQNMNENQKEGE